MDTPVLIVGAGPSGATTALLLAQLGIKSIVISKHRGTANTPRAHIFNQRAMEVLRSAGLEEELMPIACPATGTFVPNKKIRMKKERSKNPLLQHVSP